MTIASVWHDSDDDEFLVDVASKKTKKLRLSELNTNESSRLPVNRFMSVGDIERELKKRKRESDNNEGELVSWVDAARQRNLERKKLSRLNGASGASPSSDTARLEDKLLHSAKALSRNGKAGGREEGKVISGGSLNYEYLGNLNRLSIHKGRVSAVGFASSNVMFSAGVDKSLKLFSVDPKNPELLVSTSINRFPILDACWVEDNSGIVCVGEGSRTLQQYDIETQSVFPMSALQSSMRDEYFVRVKSGSSATMRNLFGVVGNKGSVYVIDNRVKTVVRCFCGSGVPATSLAFHPNTSRLFSGDEEGQIFEWDLVSGRCYNKWMDDGALKVTSLASSPGGPGGHPILSVGSVTGFVSLYNIDTLQPQSTAEPPKPFKTFGNLVTSVSGLVFHPNQPVLASFSDEKADAVRLIYTGGTTTTKPPSVFHNWPPQLKSLQKVTCMDLSQSSGWVACGNNKGIVKLFQLCDVP